MTEWAIIDITEVHQDAVKVEASSVEPGDLVFDIFGGRHPVATVRPLKGGIIKIVRADGFPSWLNDDDLITIVRRLQ